MMSTNLHPETFGAWLKRQRRLLDLTQEQLGQLAGCSGAAVRKFEAEERRPSHQLAGLIAAALQISPDEREHFIQLARGIYTAETRAEPALAVSASFPNQTGPPDHLPHPLTSLVNRVKDAAAVADLLADPAVRWVTLLGPPGIGKTRLSIQVGRQVLVDFSAGVWFVDLAPLEQAEQLVPALARTLADLGLPTTASLTDLANTFRDLSLLLVLDNFEHIPSAEREVAGLLKHCPHFKVLATSRLPLQIYGEYEYRLPPLSTPASGIEIQPENLMEFEAVQLFVSRARQHHPSFTVTAATAGLLVNVCATLEGIPLAIELAAASLKQMPLQELDAVLHTMPGESWIKALEIPLRDLPARQHTLENVVGWSYRLLTTKQQALFAALSLFDDWFEASAVSAICFDAPHPSAKTVRRQLDELADHSLLERSVLAGIPHWRMLAVIREYAALQTSPQRSVSLELRFAAYFQTALHQPQPVQFFKTYIGSLLRAMKWFIAQRQSAPGFEMAEHLGKIWASWGYFQQGLDLLTQLFDLPDDSPPQVRARRLEQTADMAWQVHNFEKADQFMYQAVELGRSQHLDLQHAWFLNRLGRIKIEQGQYVLARQIIQESLNLCLAAPNSFNAGIPLAQLGEIAFFEGNLPEAQSKLEQALTLLSAEDAIFIAISRTDLGEIALARQDYALARRWFILAAEPARQQMRRSLVLLCSMAGWLIFSNSQQAGVADQQTDRLAARLYGALETWSRRSGIRLSAFYQTLNQKRIQILRQRLGSAAWQEEFALGGRWDWEETLLQMTSFGRSPDQDKSGLVHV